ncbi:hypothetical protein GSI_02686 [Ganoderma sinense ZZ0214-1]|uniref:NAD(P)-binding domain-containing protein n=1 Tax=Ganoderma sinense ZZ0214-1 TaxID=1077348 RepID=A0A2G8SMC8_9APHY|nr:hypothetical protein GSI_02686 [Ganoderma sinense ZZ0214-1]
MSEPYPTVWFSTSTGVGRAVTEVTLEKGDIVVATARQPNSLDDLSLRYTTDRLLILPLDVTQPDQIAAAFAEAERNARSGASTSSSTTQGSEPEPHVRRFGRDKATPWKDAAQTAEAICKIACVPDPPLHFVLGKDAIGMARKKVAELVADIDTYEPVSESLEE